MATKRPATSRTYTERVLRVLVHIQEHLGDDLPLEELARIADFSPFHFHRIFRGLVGESVAQHLRRLRLERAAGELRIGRKPIVEVAFDAGYEAHESFTRAFRKAFDCSPSEFRTAAARMSHVGSPDLVHHSDDGDIQFQPITYKDSDMKIETRRVEPMRVAFIRHTGPYDQVGAAWERLCSWAGPKGLFGPDTRMLGASFDDPEVTPPDKLRYDACLTVDDSVEPEGEVGVHTLPGGEYAVTIHEGPYDKLGETYARMFGEWFASQGREPGPAPCLEFYLNDPESTEPDDLLTEVCIAVQPTPRAESIER